MKKQYAWIAATALLLTLHAGVAGTDQKTQTLTEVTQSPSKPDESAEASAPPRSLAPGNVPRPLFDGRTLEGWEGAPQVWRVRDGVIVGGSMDGNPRNEFLATTRPYSNFLLRLEYKLVGTEGFVNGGVQFRSVRVAKPSNEMSGYQADIGAGYSGCLYDESRRNRFLARAPEALIKRVEKPGDWNLYEVHCEGARVRIVLNGEPMVDFTEKDAAVKAAEGLIALQIHGSSKAEISFRNITITELPAASPTP
jgi:hypothetical protein